MFFYIAASFCVTGFEDPLSSESAELPDDEEPDDSDAPDDSELSDADDSVLSEDELFEDVLSDDSEDDVLSPFILMICCLAFLTLLCTGIA